MFIFKVARSNKILGKGVCVMLIVLFLSFWTGEALANHVSGSGYVSSGHLTSDGNVNRCHSGSYSSEAQYASGTWSTVTTNKLNMYYNCSNVEIRTKSIDLGVASPLGYVVICPPVPYVCLNAYTGAGSNTNLDTVWVYSEAILNSNSSALGGAGSTANNRRHTFLHEMGHGLTSLAHRSESGAVMRQGKLNNITPISTEISLMEAKY
ncbi:hypothetical protein MNBD_CHLOROFLEXI01-1834 [hydrothermal vent metagenome]|uniref:Uncharacterized protein n=1 Tax=hydrothermal vent metagenome TaxID=652676 RepID=A0A3B0US64_9ZZZZ